MVLRRKKNKMSTTNFTKDQILRAETFQVIVSMEDLLTYGSWDFTSDHQDECEHREAYDKSYEQFKNDCNVEILFLNGSSTYEIQEWNGNGRTIWAALSTGDDEQTALDIEKMIADGIHVEIVDVEI